MAVFRLKIDGRWEPSDFIDTLEAVETLYYMALDKPFYHWAWLEDYRYFAGPEFHLSPYDSYLDTMNRAMLARARRVIPGGGRLFVKRIEFASPGGMDFAGVGQAADAVERLVGRLIDFFADRRLRRERDKQAAIETEIRDQNLASLKIDNARKLLELHRAFPDAEHLIALAVRGQDKLADRIAQGMITGTGSDTDEK